MVSIVAHDLMWFVHLMIKSQSQNSNQAGFGNAGTLDDNENRIRPNWKIGFEARNALCAGSLVNSTLRTYRRGSQKHYLPFVWF